MPSNRQWALLTWAVIVLIWALTRPEIRRNLGTIARTILKPTFLVMIGGYLGVVSLAIFGGAQVGLWGWALASDTLTWLFVSGWAVWASFARVNSEPDFFMTHLRQIIGWSILVEVLLDFAALPLILELALVPLLVLLGAMQAYARSDEQYATVGRLATGCLAFTGFGLMIVGGASLVAEFEQLEWAVLGRRLVLPIWLTVAVLPYVYLLGVYTAYDSVLRQIAWRSSQGWRQRAAVRLALVTTFGLKGRHLGQLGPSATWGLGEATNWGEARTAIQRQKREDAVRQRERQRLARRLVWTTPELMA